MDFLMGSITTLVVAYFVARLVIRERQKISFVFPRYNQSHNHQLLSPLTQYTTLEEYVESLKIKTQATDHFDSKHTRLVIMDDYAYWIKNNRLWCAQFNGQGIDENSTKEVDTMGMDKVELNKMITVVDKLTEGKQNDGGSTGHSKF